MIPVTLLLAACAPLGTPPTPSAAPTLDHLGQGELYGQTADAAISIHLAPHDAAVLGAAGPIHLPLATAGAAWTPGCLDPEDTDCPTEAIAAGPGLAESWTVEPTRLWHRIRVDSPDAWPVLRAGDTTVRQLDATTLELAGNWRYHGLRGWDADGHDLGLRFEVTHDAIHIDWDTEPTSWPVWIDPWVDGSYDQFLTRSEGGQVVRGAFHGVGDVNADGIDDAISAVGAAIYLGTPEGIGEVVFATFDTPRPFAGILGHNITGRGERDLLFPCLGAGNAMSLHTVDAQGTTELLETYPVWYYPVYDCWPAIGDFNGDGADDIAAGLSASSATRVFYGGASHSAESYDVVGVESTFGYANARFTWAANVNGDAFDDLVVSFREYRYYEPAWAYEENHVLSVRLGTADGIGPTALLVEGWIPGNDTYIHEGFAAGDVNGDDLDDIVLVDIAGWLWLIPGTTDARPVPIRQFRALPGCHIGEIYDESVYPGGCRYPDNYQGDSIGDINGDGYGDIGIDTRSGYSVVLGGPYGLVPVLNSLGNFSNAASSKLGDVNGDSLDDFAVGTAFVFFGAVSPDIDNDGFPNEADCEPYLPDAFPGGVEVLGTRFDEDCDGLLLCHGDLDNDGGGDASEVLVPAHPDGCEGAGAYSRADDCAPGDPSLSPVNTDLPDDDIDQNCDGAWSCFVDFDGDGYGAPSPREVDAPCSQRLDLTTDRTDCDDDRDDVHPGAPDVAASGVDEDCDGIAMCATDDDLDGFGTPGSAALSADGTCDHPGLAPEYDDCGPYDPSVFPGGEEIVADDLDNDCDGGIACFVDEDGDGVGTDRVGQSFRAVTCDEPESYVSLYNNDCNDRNPRVSPQRPEIVDDYDNDCDGFALCARDLDGDRRVSPDSPADLVETSDCRTLGHPYGTIGDCEPLDGRIHNGAIDQVNQYDENCDGYFMLYQDEDGDGYGTNYEWTQPFQPNIPVGFSLVNTDCDDDNPVISPGSPDVVGDAVDQDCDGLLTCFRDRDGDSWGSRATLEIESDTCYRPRLGASDVSGDCADRDPSIRPPNLDRSGDGVDADCDGIDGIVLEVDRATGSAIVRGAEAAGELVLVGSIVGPGQGACPPALGGGCVGLLRPVQLRTVTADADGVAEATLRLPAGQPVWLQAWHLPPRAGAAWASPVVAVP